MPIRFRLNRFLSPIFVETGYGNGDGVRKALNAGFSRIYSIEIKPERKQQAAQNFPKAADSGRVTVITGDSATALGPLLDKLGDVRCTFWLDAHCSKKATTFPLMQELDAIAAHSRNDHIILIDDLRVFEKWKISLDAVYAKLHEINPDYTITRIRGQRPRDVLAAVYNTGTDA
jgi:hypothetical protein